MIASTENTITRYPITKPATAKPSPSWVAGERRISLRAMCPQMIAMMLPRNGSKAQPQDTADKTDHGERIGLAGRYVHGCPLQSVTLRLIDTYR